ncbi:hypothetical protein LC653_09080 [Nostoc sp. CHAB 5784]|uniref:hypothetical protein n=1 Tax=Nostoc mirabile TaxID=2907820 RepID=UPI001E52715D|nr:hypothetical protein [Nostoc mirabile]MCC5664068.1 hypothetical protein [Nostoc mirabile CHAB5784]
MEILFQYAWVKASTLCQSCFFNEPQRRREASAPLRFPDLFAPVASPKGRRNWRDTEREEREEREGKNCLIELYWILFNHFLPLCNYTAKPKLHSELQVI